AEAVGIVFAAREPIHGLEHVSGVKLVGLRNGDARALLSSAVQFTLDAQVRDRIVAETRGKPLALLELPQGLAPSELAGGFGLLEAKAVPDHVEDSFLRRLRALPEETRRLILIAAAEPTGDPLLVSRAARQLGVSADFAAAADVDGLL